MREGNFSELLSPNPWYSGVHQLYFPGTCPKLGSAGCTPIPGNIIPASMLSPNGIAILNAYPAPTPGFLQGTQNWVAQAAQPINQRKDVLSADILPNEKNRIEFRRSNLAYNEYDPFDQGSGETAKYFNRPNQTNAVTWTWTISPTWINEARASVSLDDVYIPVNTSEIGFNRQELKPADHLSLPVRRQGYYRKDSLRQPERQFLQPGGWTLSLPLLRSHLHRFR